MGLKSSKERGLSSQIFESYSYLLDIQVQAEGIRSLEVMLYKQKGEGL